MKNLRLFKTVEDFNKGRKNIKLPNLNVIRDTDKVIFNYESQYVDKEIKYELYSNLGFSFYLISKDSSIDLKQQNFVDVTYTFERDINMDDYFVMSLGSTDDYGNYVGESGCIKISDLLIDPIFKGYVKVKGNQLIVNNSVIRNISIYYTIASHCGFSIVSEECIDIWTPNPGEFDQKDYNMITSYPQTKCIMSYDMSEDIVDDEYEDNYVEEFVDLGLSVQWASCNVGATKPEESGLYFAWGETKGYKVEKGLLIDEEWHECEAIITNADGSETTKQFMYDYSDYEHYDVGTTSFTKYNDTDGLTVLQSEDDACSLLDSSMRMPTKEECQELLANTTSAWTENYNESGVNGIMLTSNINGNSIFVPAVGFVYGGVLYYFGLFGSLWSSSLDSSFVEDAFLFLFDSDEAVVGNDGRFYGFPLRAVRP